MELFVKTMFHDCYFTIFYICFYVIFFMQCQEKLISSHDFMINY